jgi:adenine-specific DNA methylase
MILKECKRLAEVDFPIAEVSKHAAREKSIRHGHPSTLHLWWARRPLASSRAVLLALLWPDPCDPLCPEAFKEEARKRLREVGGCHPGTGDEDLRRGLLKFIADFANWDLAANRTYLDVARALVRAAYPEEPPLVVDPFAGGGSIPLEALRVGCEAFASDLNPVACLILKVMLEDIPRHGPDLAAELRRVGAEIKQQAEKELAEIYPKDPDGSVPIAYLWARTVRCEAPNCGAEIPLVRSFWLCKKASRKRALRPKIVKGGPPRVEFEVFEPKTEKDVPAGTVSRARATCLCCRAVLPPERVRAQLAVQRGGADVVFDKKGKRIGGARMLALVTLKPGEQGRYYRLPMERDYEAVWKAQQRVAAILDAWGRGGKQGLCPVPDEPTPAGGGSGAGRAFSVQKYGMMQWGDLFTARQKVALLDLGEGLRSAPASVGETGSASLSRLADKNASLAVWNQIGEKIEHVFGRQALPIVWDFAEVPIFSESTGNFLSGVDLVAKVIEAWPGSRTGQVQTADATEHPLPDETAQVWFTDPPYYDAVPYADLSDFFFVWLKRALPEHPLLRDPFDPANPLTPKAREAVQNERSETEDGIGSVVFAHKTTEGWEALLSGLIRGGWTITGSWPIATERPGRLRSQESAALATSVHLICRPRPQDARVGDWAEVLRALPNRVGEWMERLQAEGVRGADLVFACIGPALELYSRYSKVVDAEERTIPLGGDPEASAPHQRGYLAYVWEAVARAALEQVLGTAEARARNGAAGAFEEDARLTALFLWTLQSSNLELANNGGEEAEADISEEEDDEDAAPQREPKGFSLVFDVVRRFAQPLGIHLDQWEGRIIETKKGVVRLLAVRERARQLFGQDGAQAFADHLERNPQGVVQLRLFGEEANAAEPLSRGGRGRRKKRSIGATDESVAAQPEATTLDRLHMAMLFQAGGRTAALRALLDAEQERSPEFLRLANALSALYPRGSEEKRLLDAMLLSVPR